MSPIMIASVLHLDRPALKHLRVTDTYSIHRVVNGLFEDIRDDEKKANGESSGILWADHGGDARGRQILLLSNRTPSATSEGGYGSVKSKPVTSDFLGYSYYQFTVVVNPTRRSSASKKLVPVIGRAEIAEWFTTRAMQSWGFQVASTQLDVGETKVLRFKDKKQRQVTLAQAKISGTLRVDASERFKQSFTFGIGRGRAFGCGLLQIVPQNRFRSTICTSP